MSWIRCAAYRAAAAAIVVSAVTAGYALPAAAAPTASVNATAALVAKGARVDVTVVYTCSADSNGAGIDLTLVQAVSRGQVATGRTQLFFLPCDGTTHTLAVPITPSGGLAFKTGPAVVSGRFDSCDQGFTCSTVDLGREIRVTK